LCKVVLAPMKGIGVSELLVLRPKKEIYNKFLFYRLLSYDFINIVDASTYGAKMPRANWSFIGNLKITIPSYKEQKTIVDFLDQKSSEINSLIYHKKRMFNLLQEYRKSFISEIMTKGLNPNQEKKNSGIHWIGDIPEDWECIRLKYISEIIDCKHRTPSYKSEGIPIVSPGTISANYLDLSNCLKVSKEDYIDLSENRKPKKGDIVYSRNASIGIASYVNSDQPFCIGQNMVMISPKLIEGLYLFYCLNSEAIKEQSVPLQKGSTYKMIKMEVIRNIIIPLPPKKDQITITTFLEQFTKKLDSLFQNIQNQIELLGNYLQVLISEVLSGKIDVRSFGLNKN